MAMGMISPLEEGIRPDWRCCYTGRTEGRERIALPRDCPHSCDEADLEDAEKVWLWFTTKKARETPKLSYRTTSPLSLSSFTAWLKRLLKKVRSCQRERRPGAKAPRVCKLFRRAKALRLIRKAKQQSKGKNAEILTLPQAQDDDVKTQDDDVKHSMTM
jgi:hypothetical protein